MKERIQMRGHCQGCGHLQAATSGVLAHHGYTVEHGYFHGTCYGARELPLEVSRELLDRNLEGVARQCERWEDEALKLEQREIDPKGKTVRERGPVVNGRREHVDRFIPYAELKEWDKQTLRDHEVYMLRRNAKGLRQWADDMRALAEKVHGKPLIEIKVNDQSKVISVGDRVKVCGQEVEVTKIEGKTARGVSYSVNGQYLDHVFWIDADGKEYSWPKRFARKIAPQEA